MISPPKHLTVEELGKRAMKLCELIVDLSDAEKVIVLKIAAYSVESMVTISYLNRLEAEK